MLANRSSTAIGYICHDDLVSAVLLRPEESATLPAGWQRLTLWSCDGGYTDVTPCTQGHAYLNDGKIQLQCNTSFRFVCTVADNPRYRLRVQNRTSTAYTFLDDADRCVIVLPHSFMIVTGKTMIASELVPPTSFCSISAYNNMLLLDEVTTVLTFTPLPNDALTSDVVIEAY